MERDIVGHGRQLRYLRRCLQAGRLAHAYLFHGPRGAGKCLVARSFAEAMLCSCPGQQEALAGCGVCRSCSRFRSGAHPDYQFVAPESGSIRIARVREMQARLGLASLEASRKVVIIDDADLMTREAANSLLKTLEEPPGGSVIILVSSAPEKLPGTVVSRCQGLSFGAARPDELERLLIERAGVDQSMAKSIYLATGGLPGRALEMASSEKQGEARGRAQEILSIMGSRDAARALELAASLEKGDPRQALGCLEIGLREFLLLAGSGPLRERILGSMALVRRCVRWLDQNVNRKLVLGHLLLELCCPAEGGAGFGHCCRGSIQEGGQDLLLQPGRTQPGEG